MAERAFIDTNVFVYAADVDEPAKRKVANGLIQQLAAERRGVISSQVLVEYVSGARRKLGHSFAQCRQGLLLMSRFEVVLIKPELVLGAVDLAGTHSLSHWDALIVKAASVSGCRVVLTEDLNHGQMIDGVRIENPFSSASHDEFEDMPPE